MRFVEFTEVVIQPVSEKQIRVSHMSVTIVAEHVCYLAPDIIPLEVMGPDGQSQTKVACRIFLPGKTVLVTCTKEEAEYKIKSEDKKVKKPEKTDER